MSEYNIDLEKLKALKDKLYQIRNARLDTVDQVVERNNKLIERLDKLDEQLKEAQSKLGSCDVKEIARWVAIARTIEVRKKVLGAVKMALKENRLALTFLVKEEKRIEYLVRKLKKGVED